jgi:uncharacterized membrane protein
MALLDVSLVLSTLFCALVTGFILTFAIVVMPGLSKLNDKDFLRAFQLTDGMIQNNQPIFLMIWIGSVISVVALMISSTIAAQAPQAWLTVFAGVAYLLGVQGITLRIHLPLNGRVQSLPIDELDERALQQERLAFEQQWNYFNNIRTAIAFAVSLTLLTLTALR